MPKSGAIAAFKKNKTAAEAYVANKKAPCVKKSAFYRKVLDIPGPFPVGLPALGHVTSHCRLRKEGWLNGIYGVILHNAQKKAGNAMTAAQKA